MFQKLLLLVCLILLMLTGCPRKNKAEIVRAIRVKTVQPQTVSQAETYTTVGSIEAKDLANLSAKVQGRIAGVYVQMGDFVRENQILIALEKDDLANQNVQTRASLSQAELNFEQTKANFQRYQQLYKDGLISQQQYDSYKTQYEVSESQLKQVQAGLAVSDNQLNYTEIKAPFSGFIGYCNTVKGETVNPGVPLLSVVNLSKVYVTVNLNNDNIGRVKKDQVVKVKLQSYPAEQFPGRVVQIAPAANALTKTFPVRVELDNPGQKIKAGMIAEVRFDFSQK
jgi:RND family efflux transporter MFP subunit